MYRFFLLALCLLAGGAELSAQSMWQDVPAGATPIAGERRIVPSKFRAMRLDIEQVRNVLAVASVTNDFRSSGGIQPVLEIPTPDGKTSRFQVVETPVMAPELQAKYPEIRCYTGRSTDGGAARIKLDVTPWGFHAMITGAQGGAYFIDPTVQGNTEYYSVYFKKDFLPADPDVLWSCGAIEPDGADELSPAPLAGVVSGQQGDTQLRRYRLALACTGEYAGFHGGTKPLVLAAMNTTMNRVNGVYETDLAITMRLIPNNDLLIYLNAGSDPYTNDDGGLMTSENIDNCNAVIGNGNYDIGHVFSTGGGGIAARGVICNTTYKAAGVTGSDMPVGDPFDIDYVAHEMGHQFGAPHTFNGTAGSCQGNASTSNAVEPGSGTTIMAYAGICAAQDVQPHSDAYFHAKSLTSITQHAINGSGNTCAEKIATSNHNPNVSAGADYTIPKSTPFALTAVGSDIDGDTLTYTWEQMDAAMTTNPPSPTSTTGPLFRSFTGTSSPTRVFPRLDDIINNVTPTWEKLPSVARAMNFRVVLRDNDWQAGCTDEDDMVVTVSAAAGPFVVTAPNTNVLWNVETTQTVTWNVASTNAAPVSCANVRILLSTDGGYTYPVILAAGEPNDGSATIVVPNYVSNTCRVKVEGIGNIFFDISNTNFRIGPPLAPTYFLTTSAGSISTCAGQNVGFNVSLSSELGFNTPATISVTGAPVGATVQIGANPLTPAGSTTITIGGLTSLMAGAYVLNVQTVAGSITRTANVVLTVLPGTPDVATLNSPANGARGVSSTAQLSWSANYATGALVEVATHPNFLPGTIVFSQTVTGNITPVSGLNYLGIYYWRVKANNSCDAAGYSVVHAFQVGTPACDTEAESTDVPKTIDNSSVNTVTSIIEVTGGNTILDVNVSLELLHTYVSDLVVKLVSPSNDTIDLFDQPGIPATGLGCGGDNADLTFDSEAAQNASLLESQCNPVPPALSGTYQPLEPLSILNGKNANGTWKLVVTDNYNEDGGNIQSWHLSFCFPSTVPAGTLVNNDTLNVQKGGSRLIDNDHLLLNTSGLTGQSKFILLSLPAHGTLKVDGLALGVGAIFSQADIDGGLLSYEHNGDASLYDSFTFDAEDTNNHHWIQNETFDIRIIENNLTAVAQGQGLVCHGDQSGVITVTATGLDGVYTYSLNGAAAQNTNVFTGLGAGAYTVVVTGQFGFTVESNVVTINEPDAVSVNAVVDMSDITVTATGGTGLYQYRLNGVDFQAENNFTGIANGVYTITVKDENGCTGTTEVIVAVNDLVISAVVQSQITCAGESDGIISVNVGGGQMPYTFSLSPGNTQGSGLFTGLGAGDYVVTVTDNVGFTAVSPVLSVVAPAPITATATAVLNVVTVNANGGTGALEYSLGSGYQSSNVFTGLTNGTYMVFVRDVNGCTFQTSVVVNVDPLALTASALALDCFGASDGMITAAAIGGIPPYEYKLDNGAYQSSNEFTGLPAGGYLVWVKDGVGTEVTFEVTIASPTEINIQIAVTGNDAATSFSGGVPPYTYSTDAPSVDLQNLPNGVYQLVVTDAHGCTRSATFEIKAPALSGNFSVTPLLCADANTGSVTVSGTGGIPPYEYAIDGGLFQAGGSFSGLAAGTHTVVIRDSEGNTANVEAMVSAPDPLVLDATVAGFTISASASGGVGPYQYSLNGGTPVSIGVFNGLTPASYTVTAIDANGCTASQQLLVISSATVEPTELWGLAVAPNPGAGLFQINLQRAPESLQMEVFSADGRRVLHSDLTPVAGQIHTAIDLREAPNGTYFLRLSDGRQTGGVRLSKVE